MINQFLLFMLVGLGAQLVDGAIGMAYGVISTTILLSIGIPPVVASAAVHTAEIATTGISGISHAMFKNIDYALFRRLVIPGIMGSIIGSYLLTKIPTQMATPFISTYLLIMGIFILYRAFQKGKLIQAIKTFFVKKILKRKLPSSHARGLMPLGFAGGFFDAAGGGGWGAIVTSSLLAQGTTPHFTIGSVNLTEFLVTVSASATFFFTIGLTHWPIIIGLVVGGAIGAPLAAYLVRRIDSHILMLMVGVLIILLSIRNLVGFFV